MNHKSIAIIAGVVVVIVAIAAVWYLYSDDDDGYPSIRAPVVGDYFVFEGTITDSDGVISEYIEVDTIIGEDDEGNQLVRYEYDDGRTEYDWVDGRPYWIEDDPDSYELVGQDTFDSPLYGEVVCDVYVNPYYDGTAYVFYIEGTDVYVGQTWDEDGSYRTEFLVDTSAFGDAPVFDTANTMVDSISAGDYYVYYIEEYDSQYIETYGSDENLIDRHVDALYVFSVEEDGYLFGWYTLGVDSANILEASEILDVQAYDVSEGTGTYLIETYLYGDVLCTKIVTEYEYYTEYAYVGILDGVVYSFVHIKQDDTYFICQLFASSFVYGSFMERTGEFRDQEPGDYTLSVIFEELPDGTLDVRVRENIAGVHEDGDPYYDVYYNGVFCDHVDGEIFEYSEDDASYPTEILITYYGPVECYVCSWTDDDGITHTGWYAVDDEIEWKHTHVDEDGYQYTMYPLRCTQAETGPLEDPVSIFS